MRIRSYKAQEVSVETKARTMSTRTAAPIATPSPSTDTIVPAIDAASTPSRPSTEALTREQRYRELLAMGNSPESAAVQTALEQHPVAAAASAGPQSAALAKPLQPIVNAASGLKPGVQPPTVQHTSTPNSDSPPNKKPDEPPDPNSDTTPPHLVSIEFIPPQVHDGEETLLAITATDDLSGIRGISGTLTSPTGKALQGFAQQREGVSDRYVSRITIPKDAEEGIWKISFLNLSDNATNMTTLSYAQGTIPPNAVLKVVSSRSDNAAPTLRAVSLQRRAMRSGETNYLYVEAEDDKSGVRLVSAVFVSPSKQARLGFGCKKTEGDVWECAISPPECLDCGDWSLEQVQMQDNANNYVTIRQDNPLIAAIKLNVAGLTCDNTPPVLQNLMLDKSVLVLGVADAS